LSGEQSNRVFESNVEDFVADDIVTPPLVVDANIPLVCNPSYHFTM